MGFEKFIGLLDSRNYFYPAASNIKITGIS
jgi:hypothetical protein